MNTCVSYEVPNINHATRSTVHIFHILHSMFYVHITEKYGCHITNVSHTVLLILYWYIDPTLVHICAKIQPTTTYEVPNINHVTRSTVHIFHILYSMFCVHIIEKYGCHITNVSHTVLLILYWYIDPTLVHICAKIQPTTTYGVPNINHITRSTVHIFHKLCSMFCVHITEKIWLSHYKCISLSSFCTGI